MKPIRERYKDIHSGLRVAIFCAVTKRIRALGFNPHQHLPSGDIPEIVTLIYEEISRGVALSESVEKMVCVTTLTADEKPMIVFNC